MNAAPLLAIPATVTMTGPVVAELGTVTMMLLVLQLATLAIAPLNVTVLLLCAAPNLEPVIVMAWPAVPAVGFTELMFGGCKTVKPTLLLA
jgi:hypothetical protein